MNLNLFRKVGMLFRKTGLLGTMLLASLLLHAALIATLTFAPPDPKVAKDKMPPLEVVLVNAKTETAPDKADALAQANLDRGGNTEQDRKAKSPLPSSKRQPAESKAKPIAETRRAAKAAQLKAEAERQQQRVAELEKKAQELMTQMQAQQKVESKPVQQAAAPEPEPEQSQQESAAPTIDAAALVARSLDMARLEAQIAKQHEEYQKRPKRRFIGARAREYRFAAYVEAWRQKVEKIGNLNYPVEAKERKIYGKLRKTVSIKADGSLEKLEINHSSGHPVLDEAAQRIVRLAAPFAPFPDNISKDTDILSITRTWTFTKQDSLASE